MNFFPLFQEKLRKTATRFSYLTSYPKLIFAVGLVSGLILTAGLKTLPILYRAAHNSQANFLNLPLNSYIDLGDLKTYQNLPVAQVKSYLTPNAKGTVVFIPQYHKNPGSDAADSKNDSAQKAQDQIYQILKFLVNKTGIKMGMDEGDLYGEVPAENFAPTANKIQALENLTSSYQTLKEALQKANLDPNIQKDLFANIDSQINSSNRDVTLGGALIKLKAEGSPITIYGAEDKNTQDESRVIARDYIYLQDRMDQLNNPIASNTQNAPFTSSFDPNNYQQLLQLLSQNSSSIGDDFGSLINKAQSTGQNDLVELLKKTQQAFNNLANPSPNSFPLVAQTSTGSATARNDNPYANINDKSQIENLTKADEKKINETIIQKRNKETAENFAKALKDANVTTGILQFGAGHEDGLVQELQKQGLSVIVVTANEVQSRNNQPQPTN